MEIHRCSWKNGEVSIHPPKVLCTPTRDYATAEVVDLRAKAEESFSLIVFQLLLPGWFVTGMVVEFTEVC